MTLDDLIEHYGSPGQVAEALGVTPQAVSRWKTQGKVPIGRQWQAMWLTDGKLEVDDDE